MNGKLDPEERVLSAVGQGDWLGQLSIALAETGLQDADELEVVVGGTSVYEIDGPGSKWSPLKGTRKYNKDTFIVIRRPQPVVSSVPGDWSDTVGG